MRQREIISHIKAFFNEYRPLLGLEDWRIDLNFNEKENAASCYAQPIYEDARLAFNIERLQREIKSLAALEELVVHEMVHCIIWKSSERAVTQVSRAILRAHGRILGEAHIVCDD